MRRTSTHALEFLQIQKRIKITAPLSAFLGKRKASHHHHHHLLLLLLVLLPAVDDVITDGCRFHFVLF